MPALQRFALALPGGINQSTPEPTPSDLEAADNFTIFRGRLALRAPISVIRTISGNNSVLAVLEHVGKLWAIVWKDSADEVLLYSMNIDGSAFEEKGTIWESVTSAPVVSAVSFTAGDATESKTRIYISDYDQNKATRYWDDAAGTITTLDEDIDNDSSKEDLKFSLLFVYKFHLWGTGFFEGTPARPEMVRFSQPGAIPGTDIAGGDNPKVFFSSDHRSVGRRGDKITAGALAGDRLVLFQQRGVNAIFGSGSDTWTRQELSNVVGCVGPQALASVDDRMLYFWASDGPYRTDGSSIQYIGEPIRQLVTEVDAAEYDTVLGYSPDDGLLYCIVSPGGEDSYQKALVFDTRRERWLTTEWLTGDAANIQIGALAAASAGTGAAPGASPTDLTANDQSPTQIHLAWTNGDTNINTVTHIYRDTSTVIPNDSTNKIAEVASGVATYEDTELTAGTKYYYEVRHFRNNAHSSSSLEVNETTRILPPTITSLTSISFGLRIAGNTVHSGANVVIERKVVGGSFAVITTLTTPGTTYSYDDTGVTCDTIYAYRTQTKLSGKPDSDYSNESQQTACTGGATIPTVPSGFSATTDTGFPSPKIDLVWTDNSDNEDEFEIYRSFPTNGSYLYLTSAAANATTYSDTTQPDDDTSYYYKIRAKNTAGSSAFTAENYAVLGSA